MLTLSGFYHILDTHHSSWRIDAHIVDRASKAAYPQRARGDVEVNPGNSGGPVYLEDDASVIGVCVSFRGSNIWTDDGTIATILGRQLFYSSGLTTIIPSKYILDILEKHGIDIPSTN